MTINAYLSFNGNCKEAFEFYQKALGGEITYMSTYGESPMAEQTPPEQLDRIMHARLIVGDAVLMGSDAPPQFFSQPQGFTVSINVDGAEEGKSIFTALSEGGQVRMAFEKTFWAEGFGMVIDKFGTPWMVNAGMSG